MVFIWIIVWLQGKHPRVKTECLVLDALKSSFLPVLLFFLGILDSELFSKLQDHPGANHSVSSLGSGQESMKQ